MVYKKLNYLGENDMRIKCDAQGIKMQGYILYRVEMLIKKD